MLIPETTTKVSYDVKRIEGETKTKTGVCLLMMGGGHPSGVERERERKCREY